MTYYKTLDGLETVNGGSHRYPGVGRWTAHLDPDRLVACKYGYHLTQDEQVLDWLGPTIYVAEPCDEHPPVDGNGKLVTCRVRLVRRTAWDNRVARLFAVDCAERVLPVYEAHCPGDARPREAIRVARAHAAGEATFDDLTAVRAAARDAAKAAKATVLVTARAAAWVAWAAEDAAKAAWAAWAAAWAARDAAVKDVPRAAARAVAWDAERSWQYRRLTYYLNGD